MDNKMDKLEDQQIEKQFIEEVLENGGSLDLDFSNDLHHAYYLSELRKLGADAKKLPRLFALLEGVRKAPVKGIKKETDSAGSVEGPSDIAYIEVPSIFKVSTKDTAGKDGLGGTNLDTIVAVQSTAKYCEKKSSVLIQSSVTDERNGRTLTNTNMSRDCYDAMNLTELNTENVFDGNPRKYSLVSTFTSTSETKEGALTLQASCTVRKELALGEEIIERYEVIDPKPKVTKGDHVRVSYNRDTVMKNFDYSIDNIPMSNPDRIRFMLDVCTQLTLKNGYRINGLQKNALPVLTLDHPEHGVVKCFYYSNTKAPLVEITNDGKTAKVTLPKEPGERKAADWYSFLPFEELADTACDNLNIYGQFIFSVTDKATGSSFPYPVSFRSEKGDMEFNAENIKNEPIYMQWGCIGKDTMITMGDKKKTKVEISELKEGQIILTANGHMEIIQGVIYGAEDTILTITTETERSIQLTRAHSIKTDKGWIPVSSLREGMKVECEHRVYEMVTSISKEDYSGLVYNLAFNEPTGLIGNGFIIGDYSMQQMIKPKKKEEITPWSKETKALVLELENFSNELKNAR